MYTNAVTVDISSGDHTPSVAADGVYVGGAGNIVVELYGGAVVTFMAVPAGTVLPVRVRTIRQTSTTATLMLFLYGRDDV